MVAILFKNTTKERCDSLVKASSSIDSLMENSLSYFSHYRSSDNYEMCRVIFWCPQTVSEKWPTHGNFWCWNFINQLFRHNGTFYRYFGGFFRVELMKYYNKYANEGSLFQNKYLSSRCGCWGYIFLTPEFKLCLWKMLFNK